MSEENATPEAAPEIPENGGYLTIEQIRSAPDMATVDVDVPGWGGKVKVKPLNMRERGSIRKAASEPKRNPDGSWTTEVDAEELELEAVIQGCVQPAFGRGAKDWLREEKAAGNVSKIAGKVFELSGLGGEAEKKPESA